MVNDQLHYLSQVAIVVNMLSITATVEAAVLVGHKIVGYG